MSPALGSPASRLWTPANLAWLAVGFGLCFFSSFGQTFFIALFAREIAAIGDLSHGGYGTLYSGVNLASGFLMLWLGAQIDRIDLRRFCLGAVAGLAGSCFLLAFSPGIAVLGLALFGLRLFGQGLMSHAALTAMARHLGQFRGRGIALAALGFSVGEAVLPSLVVALQSWIGWRQVWLGAAMLLVLVLVPLLLTLVPRSAARGGPGRGPVRPAIWLLAERRFRMILPVVLAPAFILTGIFFHQVALVLAKGWSLAWFASAFVVFAGTSILSSLIAGWLVDRIGAIRLLPVLVLPLAAGCVVLAVAVQPAGIFLFMALAAMTQGAFATVTTSAWAELYGLEDLGGVRALITSATIMSAAAAPGTFGLLLDGGVRFAGMFTACSLYALAASLLAYAGLRGRYTRQQAQATGRR